MPDLQGRELGLGEVDSLAYAHTACEGAAAWLLHLSLDTMPTCLPNLSLAHSPELPTVAQKPLGGGKDRVNPLGTMLTLVSLHVSWDPPSLSDDQRYRN